MEAKEFDVEWSERGMKNSEVLEAANEEGRILLTHDHDFLKTEVYKPAAGVIVLPVARIDEMLKMLLEFLKSVSPNKLKGKAFLLSEKGRFEFWKEEYSLPSSKVILNVFPL